MSGGAARVGRLGFGDGVGIADDHRVQSGRGVRSVVGVDAGEVGPDELDGGRAAGLERVAQFGDRGVDDVDHRAPPAGATRGCCCVMQWMPPPREKSGRASTVTTSRPG